MLAKPHCLAAELDLHEVVPVPKIGGLEGQVRTDAQCERSDHRVTEVEVVMQVTGGDSPDDAIVGSSVGNLGSFEWKVAAHFPAREDTVDPLLILPFHPLQVRPDAVLLAHTLLAFHIGILWLGACGLPGSRGGRSIRAIAGPSITIGEGS